MSTCPFTCFLVWRRYCGDRRPVAGSRWKNFGPGSWLLRVRGHLANEWAFYRGRASFHGRSVAAAMRLCDASDAAAAWTAWREPASPTRHTPNTFMVVI